VKGKKARGMIVKGKKKKKNKSENIVE